MSATVSAIPVIVTRIVNADGRPFNVRVVRAGDHYGRDNHIEHDSAEPLLEFWDATHEHDPRECKHDPRYILGLGQFAGRYGLGWLMGLDGYSRDHRWCSAGLDLCDYMPGGKVTGENVMEAIAAAEAALHQIDADDAKSRGIGASEALIGSRAFMTSPVPVWPWSMTRHQDA